MWLSEVDAESLVRRRHSGGRRQARCDLFGRGAWQSAGTTVNAELEDFLKRPELKKRCFGFSRM